MLHFSPRPPHPSPSKPDTQVNPQQARSQKVAVNSSRLSRPSCPAYPFWSGYSIEKRERNGLQAVKKLNQIEEMRREHVHK